MPVPLEAFVSFGFTFFSYAWAGLTLFCIVGLAYLLVGHRLSMPLHGSINRTVIAIMVALLLFAVIYVPAVIYAAGYDHSFGYGLYAFMLTMSLPCALSLIGVLLVGFSRYPLPCSPSASSRPAQGSPKQ